MKENNTYNDEMEGNTLPDSLRMNPFRIPDDFFDDQRGVILSTVAIQLKTNYDISSSTVPTDYFETLEDRIFGKIAEENLKNKVSKDGFEVPEGYFESLAENIETAVWIDEFKNQELASDAFHTPEGYMESLTEQIMATVAVEQLKDLVSTDGYSVPADYFENLSSQTTASTFVADLKETVIGDGFEVPPAYFDQMASAIDARIKGKKIETDVPVIKMPFKRKWSTYAAVASVALIIGIGSYMMVPADETTSSGTYVQSALASDITNITLDHISDDDIVNYLAMMTDGEDLIYLSQYVEEDKEDLTIDSEIKNEDIEAYLNYML